MDDGEIRFASGRNHGEFHAWTAVILGSTLKRDFPGVGLAHPLSGLPFILRGSFSFHEGPDFIYYMLRHEPVFLAFRRDDVLTEIQSERINVYLSGLHKQRSKGLFSRLGKVLRLVLLHSIRKPGLYEAATEIA